MSEDVDRMLDAQDEADKQEEDVEESCPECGSNLEYIPHLDWGLLYCTKCPWEQRL